MASPDVVVVGGGVVGLVCARSLARRGLSVTLADPGPLAGAASPASAGMLAAQIESRADDLLLTLTIRARSMAIELVGQLEESTDLSIGLEQRGIAHLALHENEAGGLKACVAAQRQQGLRADWLEAEEVRDRWPHVAETVVGAMFAPEDGSVDPPRLLVALRHELNTLGVRHLATHAHALEVARGKLAAVRTENGRLTTSCVVLAAGVWSASVLGLPRPLPVKPLRGQLAALPWPRDARPGVFYAPGGYLVHRGDEAIAGTTTESVGFDHAPTPEGQHHVISLARTIVPALTEAPVLRAWAGLRPVSPDGHPILGADPEVDGLWYATGHGRNGILLAGLSGEALADLMVDGVTDIDLSSCRPDRFWPAASESQPSG